MTDDTFDFDGAELETGDTIVLTVDLGDKQGDLPPMEVRVDDSDWKPKATLLYDGQEYGTLWGVRDYVDEDAHFETLAKDIESATVLGIEVQG